MPTTVARPDVEPTPSQVQNSTSTGSASSGAARRTARPSTGAARQSPVSRDEQTAGRQAARTTTTIKRKVIRYVIYRPIVTFGPCPYPPAVTWLPGPPVYGPAGY